MAQKSWRYKGKLNVRFLSETKSCYKSGQMRAYFWFKRKHSGLTRYSRIRISFRSYCCCLGSSKFLFIFCSEIPFGKISHHLETSQMIFMSNQLTGFYVIRVFDGRYFRIDYEFFRKTKSPNRNLFLK